MATDGEKIYIMFPARAGMNRLLPRTRLRHFNVPRPCGDEPVAELAKAQAEACSPPVRG